MMSTSILLATIRMSQSSIRLGIILIGLGLLLWGLHIQSKYEGFQGAPSSIPAAPAMPAPTAPTAPTAGAPSGAPATTTGETPIATINMTPALPNNMQLDSSTNTLTKIDYSALSNYQIESLRIKILEIKTKFDLVNKIKLSADIKITKALSDGDTMSKINIVYSEVKSFLTNLPKLQLELFGTNESYKREKDIAIQLIYTVYDQVLMLYRIYYTIPSLVISSGAVISPDNATSMSIIDDDVIGKAASQISMEVSLIPAPSEQLGAATSALIKNTTDLQTNYSDTTLGIFQASLTKFLMLVDLEISNTDLKISNMESAQSEQKLNNIMNNKILFLTGILTTLKTVHGMLAKIQSLNIAITNNIEASITSYNTIITSTKAKNAPKEAFQSYTNPYNTPSPNITQAYEFRLGKKQYADDVFSGIKIFMS